MAKNSIDAYGASGKTNVLMFEPEKLHLVTDKTHPLYDERVHLPIDEGMVLNIKELGVLEPIIVWKDPETGLTCVVVGRQRVKHTIEANKLLLKEGKDPLFVPGVVKRGSANQMAKYMVSENEIRRPDTPLGRAKKMSDALDRGLDEDDIAVLFGCSVRPDNTIKFPDRAYQYGVYGAVHVQYDVNKDGRIENIVVKDDDEGFFTKQIVNDMKHWRLEKDHPMKAQKLTVAFERDLVRAKGGFLEN